MSMPRGHVVPEAHIIQGFKRKARPICCKTCKNTVRVPYKSYSLNRNVKHSICAIGKFSVQEFSYCNLHEFKKKGPKINKNG